MKIELIYFDEVEELREVLKMDSVELWEAGLCLDDYDYGFIIKNFKEKDLPYHFEGIMQTYTKCHVEWKEVNQRGIKFLVGMTYHA